MNRRLVIPLLCTITFCSCHSLRTVEQVPVYVHDTLSQKVYLHDSTFIDRWHTEYQRGDTVFVTTEVTKWKYVTTTDTAYKVVEQPVTVTVQQIKEVEKPLRWWQKGLMYAGAAGIFIALAVVALRTRRHTS